MEENKEKDPFVYLMKHGERLLTACVGSGLQLGLVGRTLRIVIDGVSCVDHKVAMVSEKGTKIFYFIVDGFGAFHAAAVRDENVGPGLTGIKERLEFIGSGEDGKIELVHVVNLILPDGTIVGKKETTTTIHPKFFEFGIIDSDTAFTSMGFTLSFDTPVIGALNDPT